MTDAIQADGLARSFGATRALDGVDLTVPGGSVLGLLGPNGSGKTTTVRILATLLAPSQGRARVAGYDVVGQAAAVRTMIGLTGQYAAVDEALTGTENLVMVGRLLDLGRADARRRAIELLERFDLAEAGHRPVKTYSGGMRRRLDLALSMVGRPQVLFLDEADRLADTIVVLDHGRVIARGTSDELKRQTGGQVLELRPADPAHLGVAADALAALSGGSPAVDPETGLVGVSVDDASLVAEAVRRLDDAGVPIADLALRGPSLDDVFLSLTGRKAETAPAAEPPTQGRNDQRSAA